MLGDNFVEVYVWGAAPYIKEALKLDADVTVTVRGPLGEKRILSHNAALRPTGKLPWPLTAIQPHHVQFSIEFDAFEKEALDAEDIQRVFKWEKIDEVIRVFLQNLPQNSLVQIFVM